MTPTLAYWDIRGLAQPIRLLLRYVGEEFEDKMYSCGEGPEYNKDCWFDEKFSHGLDFPNLPYYIDGDAKITQSNAILRYIGRKHNMLGTTDAEKLRVDVMLEESMDFRNGLIRIAYSKDYEAKKDGYFEGLKARLTAFEKCLGDNPWFAGTNLTTVDFVMYELLDQHLLMKQTVLDSYPKLRAFHQRFEDLDKIKAYMHSDQFVKLPCNNKMAGFK